MFDFLKKPKKNTSTVKNTASGVKKKTKNKNISRKVKIGTTLQTSDLNLPHKKNYTGKEGERIDFLNRGAVVTDTNKDDELIIHKITKGKSSFQLPKGSKNSGKVKGISPFAENKDSLGNPLKLGENLKSNPKSKSFTKSEVNYIKKTALKKSSKSLRDKNKSKYRELKGRK